MRTPNTYPLKVARWTGLTAVPEFQSVLIERGKDYVMNVFADAIE